MRFFWLFFKNHVLNVCINLDEKIYFLNILETGYDVSIRDYF